MAATRGANIATLVLRILTLVLVLVSLFLIATNSKTVLQGTEFEAKIQFQDVNSYRYLIATTILGAALNLVQIIVNIYQLATRSKGGVLLFHMFADKLLSYFLLSGATVGLTAGVELKPSIEVLIGNIFNSFFNKGNLAAIILLGAFLCSAIVSVLSSLALKKY